MNLVNGVGPVRVLAALCPAMGGVWAAVRCGAGSGRSPFVPVSVDSSGQPGGMSIPTRGHWRRERGDAVQGRRESQAPAGAWSRWWEGRHGACGGRSSVHGVQMDARVDVGPKDGGPATRLWASSPRPRAPGHGVGTGVPWDVYVVGAVAWVLCLHTDMSKLSPPEYM